MKDTYYNVSDMPSKIVRAKKFLDRSGENWLKRLFRGCLRLPRAEQEVRKLTIPQS
jgi:hypothetical protein